MSALTSWLGGDLIEASQHLSDVVTQVALLPSPQIEAYFPLYLAAFVAVQMGPSPLSFLRLLLSPQIEAYSLPPFAFVTVSSSLFSTSSCPSLLLSPSSSIYLLLLLPYSLPPPLLWSVSAFFFRPLLSLFSFFCLPFSPTLFSSPFFFLPFSLRPLVHLLLSLLAQFNEQKFKDYTEIFVRALMKVQMMRWARVLIDHLIRALDLLVGAEGSGLTWNELTKVASSSSSSPPLPPLPLIDHLIRALYLLFGAEGSGLT